MSIGKWAYHGRAIGLNSTDINMVFLQDHTPIYLGQIEKQLRDAWLSIIMTTTRPDFMYPDPVQFMS